MTRSSRGNCKTAKSTPTKMETTKRTTIETTPSNNHSSSRNHFSNSSDKSLLEIQQKGIVRYLEGKISELEGCLLVTQRGNSLLEAKIDCQEQYSRQPWLVKRFRQSCRNPGKRKRYQQRYRYQKY